MAMARFTLVLLRLILHRLPESAWRQVSQGIDVAEAIVTLPSWESHSLSAPSTVGTLPGDRPTPHRLSGYTSSVVSRK